MCYPFWNCTCDFYTENPMIFVTCNVMKNHMFNYFHSGKSVLDPDVLFTEAKIILWVLMLVVALSCACWSDLALLQFSPLQLHVISSVTSSIPWVFPVIIVASGWRRKEVAFGGDLLDCLLQGGHVLGRRWDTPSRPDARSRAKKTRAGKGSWGHIPLLVMCRYQVMGPLPFSGKFVVRTGGTAEG
jgi:hypothetical protein